MTDRTFTDFHLFCGAGGGALGFSWASRTYGAMRGRFRSLGGVDSHPRRCMDFGLLLGTPATCMDLFSADDYAAFHGKAPPEGWREATPADIRAAAGYDTLLQMGAPRRMPGEADAAWVSRALRDGPFRRLPHPGNLAYVWGLDEDARAALPPTQDWKASA